MAASTAPRFVVAAPARCVNVPPTTSRVAEVNLIERTCPSVPGFHGSTVPSDPLTAARLGRALPSTVPKPPPR